MPKVTTTVEENNGHQGKAEKAEKVKKEKPEAEPRDEGKPLGAPYIKRTVKVRQGNDEEGKPKIVEVEAECNGALAIHPQVNNDQYWAVTSVTTSARLVETKLKADAERITNLLVKKAGKSLWFDSPQKIKRAIPSWVTEWVKACHKAKAWVDPKEYAVAG